MFLRPDTQEQLSERIDQEARSAQRQKWESAVATWKTQSALARELNGASSKRARARSNAMHAEPILFEAMAERLNYLERRAIRLESELRSFERRDRSRGRTLLWSIGVASVLLLVGLAAGLFVSSNQSRRPANDLLDLQDRHPVSSVSRTR
jgi:hypothetical protein